MISSAYIEAVASGAQPRTQPADVAAAAAEQRADGTSEPKGVLLIDSTHVWCREPEGRR